jgi:2-polyprenyl-3-methyl-5-hydroxy-6-metoxy-1,4-benzoquinol methylase
MQLASLKSGRYGLPPMIDRFDRNTLFVEEARKYRNVLECGCSTGFLSRLISKGGSRVVGVEVDPDAAEQASRYCARVLRLDLDRHDWTDGIDERFDLVTFGDVLEHLVDPEAALREAKRVLVPNGRVLISLPNVTHWSVRAKVLLGRFDYQAVGILDYTHLRFFTVASARRMVQEAGYRIVRFHPVLGGRFTTRFRPSWQRLASTFPGLFAFQMLFLAEPEADAAASGQEHLQASALQR